MVKEAAMSSNDDLVRRFCAAFSRMDADELADYFSDDAVYHNIPMTPITGRANIHENFRQLGTKFESMAFELIHQVSQGDVVMNERIDHLMVKGRRIALPVMGVFELKDGHIHAWRDYFDMGLLKAPAS
jgi:limonene-1,2-epoxide hydrolase